MESSQRSIEDMTKFVDLLVDKYFLRKVSLTGGEPLLKSVFPRTAAVMAHANKRGLHVQLNTGGLGQGPIPDVISILDDPKKLAFQFSFDGAKRETMDRFRGKAGVCDSALRQMAEAVNCGVLVQAGMTATSMMRWMPIGSCRRSASTPSGPSRCSPRVLPSLMRMRSWARQTKFETCRKP